MASYPMDYSLRVPTYLNFPHVITVESCVSIPWNMLLPLQAYYPHKHQRILTLAKIMHVLGGLSDVENLPWSDESVMKSWSIVFYI